MVYSQLYCCLCFLVLLILLFTLFLNFITHNKIIRLDDHRHHLATFSIGNTNSPFVNHSVCGIVRDTDVWNVIEKSSTVAHPLGFREYTFCHYRSYLSHTSPVSLRSVRPNLKATWGGLHTGIAEPGAFRYRHGNRHRYQGSGKAWQICCLGAKKTEDARWTSGVWALALPRAHYSVLPDHLG
ncbi:hypothetical protein F5Y19DRAFT_406302 [Xylariaceae sp. FL1651]|nr:hypothetical protein F5Y19DRAFT_406302 [Xylariaceae sp. FL1651]